jgi:2'-5' RNA ligase
VRVVWAGAEESAGALMRCVEAVGEELNRLGFAPEDRPFSPHITIGRVREDSSGGRIRKAVESAKFGALDQPVESITLMSSVLSPKGPTYAAVSRAALGPGDAATKARS